MQSKDSKEALALASAADVFMRYGFARTTMGDIAAKAGMSRPALYLVFADKVTAFSRVIEHLDQQELGDIAAVLPTLPSLEAKLLHACLTWGVRGVELATLHPDAADLFDLRFAAVRQIYANFQALVSELIAEVPAVQALGATPDALARTFVFGLRGLRETATDPDDMRRLITLHVRSFTRALEA
ncbi:MAG: TetR/AcrR family transcriptional regulator [Pseudoxanthomonas sp.]